MSLVLKTSWLLAIQNKFMSNQSSTFLGMMHITIYLSKKSRTKLMDVNDEADNQEAAMLMDHLVCLALGRQVVAPQLAPNNPFVALLQAIGPVIVELNASIEKEACERNYCFKV